MQGEIMSRKPRPTVFLRAIHILERQLVDNLPYGATGCCEALGNALPYPTGIIGVWYTPEYELFFKHFEPSRGEAKYTYWFGSPHGPDSKENRPNKKNQLKRIAALKKCYKLAQKRAKK
jgi:hypothetical protein